MEKIKVFLDSSVLITAVLSEKGASFHLLAYKKHICQFIITDLVLDEALRVLERKFADRPELSANLLLSLGLAGIEIFALSDAAELPLISKILEPHDSQILAAALEHGEYLLTLDHDFLTPQVSEFVQGKNLSIMKPGEFIKLTRQYESGKQETLQALL